MSSILKIIAGWFSKAEPTVPYKPRRAPVKYVRTSDQQKIDIVGENKWNEDAKGRPVQDRQEIISKLKAGQPIQLLREPGNPVDPNAIAVMSPLGQIGYISGKLAKTMAPVMDSGVTISATIAEIRGGTADKRSRGVWLYVQETGEPK